MKRYASPVAFKQALEQRLRTASSSGPDLTRRRQLLVFDRFLARIVDTFGDTAVLKGGLVLELRLERARTTKDVDLRLVGSAVRTLERLQEAGRVELGDFLSFEVGPDDEHPGIENVGLRYEGRRFRARAQLAGKLYGQPFGVDVAFADPILGEPERVATEDLLAFIGVPPPTLWIYPVETHLAEKLHAYTMPRSRPNSRVKDLPDLALLASIAPLEAGRVAAALEQTFSFRGTHPLPPSLPEPSANWETPYAAMARSDGLPWPSLVDVFEAASGFLDPILAGGPASRWDPDAWSWHHSGPF